MKKFIGLIFLLAVICGFYLYTQIFWSNVSVPEDTVIQIPTGATYEDVLTLLDNEGILKNKKSFDLVAEKMNYPNVVKPGRYEVSEDMSNRDLLLMLRKGQQQEIDVILNGITTKEDLAGAVAGFLELDSIEFLQMLSDEQLLKEFGYDQDNIMTLFIPNTYKFYWNTTARQFLERMLHEHQKFWNEKRKQRAFDLGMSEEGVIILASIVEKEISHQDEASKVAGVYVNRLEKRMPLQADPTLKFAVGDFSIKRVLNIHKEVESPYNTYKYAGLPPGPICLPSIKTIDAVLMADSHKYLYFCAAEDFSGYHHFSKTLNEHLNYANRYHRALDARNIK